MLYSACSCCNVDLAMPLTRGWLKKFLVLGHWQELRAQVATYHPFHMKESCVLHNRGLDLKVWVSITWNCVCEAQNRWDIMMLAQYHDRGKSVSIVHNREHHIYLIVNQFSLMFSCCFTFCVRIRRVRWNGSASNSADKPSSAPFTGHHRRHSVRHGSYSQAYLQNEALRCRFGRGETMGYSPKRCCFSTTINRRLSETGSHRHPSRGIEPVDLTVFMPHLGGSLCRL